MVLSLATKAAVFNPGKVACVMHFGRACWWGWGGTFGAHDRILPEAC